MEGYAVSAQCMALVRDNCLIPTKDAPELGYIRESTDKQYVPDVYYKVGGDLFTQNVSSNDQLELPQYCLPCGRLSEERRKSKQYCFSVSFYIVVAVDGNGEGVWGSLGIGFL